jgi:hypothetical protein
MATWQTNDGAAKLTKRGLEYYFIFSWPPSRCPPGPAQ